MPIFSILVNATLYIYVLRICVLLVFYVCVRVSVYTLFLTVW